MEQKIMWYDLNGSRKFKMADSRPELEVKHLNQLVGNTETEFDVFWVYLSDETTVRLNRMVASKTESTNISACRQDRNEIPKATSMFSRSSYLMEQKIMWYDLNGSRKFKMASFKPELAISRHVDKI